MQRRIAARHLEVGQSVLYAGEVLKINSITWRNGADGREPVYTCGDKKTAVAIEIIFHDGREVFCHPGDDVTLYRPKRHRLREFLQALKTRYFAPQCR